MIDNNEKVIAEAILRGECPFGELKEGQSMGHCPLGFPSCGCADEYMINPFLTEEFNARIDKYYEENPPPLEGLDKTP